MLHEHDHADARPFTAGLVLGALIGAGLALLFAPQSGQETRRLLRRRARRVADGAQDRLEDIRNRMRSARKRVEEALD